MPTTYYVDSNQTYAATVANNGTASGTPWGGAAGIQRALAVVAAGDEIKITNTAAIDLTKLKKITSASARTGTFTVGATVTQCANTDGTGADANVTGVIAHIESTTVVWIESTGSGAWTATGTRYMFQSTGNYMGDINAVAMLGCVAVAAGTAAAPISVTGVDSSWAATTTRTVLDGQSSSTGSASSFSGFTGTVYYRITNIAATRNIGPGLSASIGNSAWTYINCAGYSNGTNGIALYGQDRVIGGAFYSNSRSGIATTSNSTILNVECHSNGASYSGIALSTGSHVANSIIRDNAGFGISIPTGSQGASVVECVIDGNSKDGINVVSTAQLPVVERCRITNNGTTSSYYGINCDAIDRQLYEDYNVFFGNGTDTGETSTHDTLNVVSGGHSLHATADGYTNRAGKNYSLIGAATGRSIAVNVTATTRMYVCAGLPPANTESSSAWMA